MRPLSAGSCLDGFIPVPTGGSRHGVEGWEASASRTVDSGGRMY